MWLIKISERVAGVMVWSQENRNHNHRHSRLLYLQRPDDILDHAIAGMAWMSRHRYRVGGMLTECRGSTPSRR